jgi:tyrosine decarboxylase/aspartate 1-decarboxylase
MVAGEFDKPTGKTPMRLAQATPFPATGAPESEVLDAVRERFARNPFPVDQNFGISYSGAPWPITYKAHEIARQTFFVEWADEQQQGTLSMERECVRMMGSLLGNDDAAGFMTTGGTESNLLSLRLARDLGGREHPEVIAPETMHFSFRHGAELMGITLREVSVGPDFVPRIEDYEKLVNRNTVGLVGSAPEGSFGQLDPIEALSDLAVRKGLYLHVDGAFGGFIFPFMRDLGYDLPPFDFSLPGVSSMMTDGHKLGMLPVSTGFFLTRNAAMWDAIPTESTLIHTISSTKNGDRAAGAWAAFRHHGRAGYVESTRHVLELAQTIVEGVTAIPGIRSVVKPLMSVVAFTSDTLDIPAIHRGMVRRGWGCSQGSIRGMAYIRLSIHPSRDLDHARGFVRGFEESVRELG